MPELQGVLQGTSLALGRVPANMYLQKLELPLRALKPTVRGTILRCVSYKG